MKANGPVIAAMLLCAIQSYASFAAGPLVLIDTVAVDPEGVAGAVDGCEFSKDGTYFVASDNHGVARIYLSADRSLVGKVTHNYHDHIGADRRYELNAVVWSHDGQFLATGRNDDGVKVWKTDGFFDPADFAQNDKPYKHLDDRGGNTEYEADGADFSPNNQWLATAAAEYLMVYSLPQFKEIQDISAGGGSVNSVDFSYDSGFVAFGASNGNVRIARTSDWTVIKTTNATNSVKSVRFSPDAKYLVYSGRDQRCKVYRTSDWSLAVDIEHSGNEKALPGDDDDSNAAVEASAWSSDGAYLLTSGLISGELHVWETSVWPASGSITLGSTDALAIYQAQEKKRQIEFIDVFKNKVIVGGDEGNVRMYEFSSAPSPKQAGSASSSKGPSQDYVEFDPPPLLLLKAGRLRKYPALSLPGSLPNRTNH